MIDLHCHVLFGVDDGAVDLAQSLEMARMAVAGGVSVMACTPHMYPGVYDNKGPDVRARVAKLQEQLAQAGIPLRLVSGADVHIAPGLVASLRAGEVLTLNDSRYLLLEPPHHLLPPRMEETFFNLLTAGYVPILTHPERMAWISQKYDLVRALAKAGAWMQLTGGALLGQFGSGAKYWSERMLDDGLIHIVATDAHNTASRPPNLAMAFEALCERIGYEEASQMVYYRPLGILENRAPSDLASPPPRSPPPAAAAWRRLLSLLKP